MRQEAPYTKSELYAVGRPAARAGRQLDEIAFPLGGIGTGMVSLGGRGQLRDWELMNRPAKGFLVPYSFFTLRVEQPRKPPLVKVLEGPVGGPLNLGGHTSVRWESGAGLPRFREVSFRGEFPVAELRLKDPDVPLDVNLEAFNPFLPLNEDDSSIPVAILIYRFRNRSRRRVTFSVLGSLTNVVGEGDGLARMNDQRRAGELRGLFLTSRGGEQRSRKWGSMVLATLAPDSFVWREWRQGRGGSPSLDRFWREIAESKKLPRSLQGGSNTGSVGARCSLKPGESIEVPFLLAWHFPNYVHGTHDWGDEARDKEPPQWKNWYATKWADAWEVARYTAKHLARLRKGTKSFRDALFSSSLPSHVLDAVSSQLSVLKSPTCLRLEDGTFYGFEGCSDTVGCCEGSCTHVWNYAQALPYLFPKLQCSIRNAEYANSLLSDGFMCFRMPLPLRTKGKRDYHPAADGQMGTVIQVYRDWQISGDDEWLARTWPRAKKALAFAWRYWDADRDGVMEGMQHNTYDIEYHGANTMMGSLYLAALEAGARMASYVGDKETAAEYRDLAERGAAWSDSHLFNGEYYEQRVNPKAREAWPARQKRLSERTGDDDLFAWPKFQYGKGCLSDQLIGQWYAEMLGLGYLYRKGHVRKALRAIFQHNWRADLSDHAGVFRLYALNDEAGLVIATWPRGGRPGVPTLYADEVWCGIEYQVASHLIYEGFVEEGLSIVKGVRDRHTGEQRNPWNEFECGHHYARSMASYAVLLALSGFSYSAPGRRIGFAPRVSTSDFRTFFSVGSGWGTYRQTVRAPEARLSLRVEAGDLTVEQIETSIVMNRSTAPTVRIGNRSVNSAVRLRRGGAAITFESPVTVGAGETLSIRLSYSRRRTAHAGS